jgi:hypothetical protein
MEVAAELSELWGVSANLVHRDLHRLVIDRPVEGPVNQ